ncbi:reverse transcriptase domain-containing protein [Tanacetum coccineum]
MKLHPTVLLSVSTIVTNLDHSGLKFAEELNIDFCIVATVNLSMASHISLSCLTWHQQLSIFIFHSRTAGGNPLLQEQLVLSQSLECEWKAITTRSGVAYDGPSIPPTPSPPSKEVECETEATKDKLREALLYSRSFTSTFRVYLVIRKVVKLASTPLNENCTVVLLKKFLEKLGDPGKFLIPCDFPKLDECLAMVDLGASINLMPLSVWKQLSLPELTSTRMTLELANRSTVIQNDVAEDVFVKVGKFYFPANFVVVDYDADLRVPLILKRPFLRMARDLIDVYGEELTLRVDDEAITFKVRNTSRYSCNYETVNQVNVIDVACEEYAQEVLGFSDSSTSGNPTPSDPIIASSSPLFTPFEGGDFILKEIETYLRAPKELSNLDDDYYDTEGDILYLEKLLNEDPSPTLPLIKNDDLKQVDVTMTKPSIEEPPELELKDLPSHLEYVFLKGTDKLPVIISKELKNEEKVALLKVLKSHKWAIAWKIFNIKVENGDNELIPPRCMMAIFHDMIEETMEVFMDDFSVFGDSFSLCLSHLDKMLKRCEDINLVLNWEKYHFMVKDSIVLDHKISKSRIKVDRAKVDVIAKLPHPTSVKGV